MNPRTVLVVDDDPGVLAAVSARLEGEGLSCTVACSGRQALGLFLEHGADLVVADLNMPGGDGQGLAENLRRISSVPIIVMSGFKDALQGWQHDAPAIHFLQKPFDSAELVDLVQRVLPGTSAATSRASQ